ncbi:MAG TPA: SprT family zinc-dependent metalloprotease [Thermoleophilaceae bacterium]|nr:SprT family zinc-dependent metalloprotease [Thermoleophilaceae bacterium]
MSATPYTVRHSDRARRARIQVTAEGVEVVVPRRLPLREVEPFVDSKRAWIERTLLRMRTAAAQRPRPRLEDGGELPFLGERLRLRVRVEPARRRAHVARRGEELTVAVAEDHPEAIGAALERWYRAQARAEVGRRLDAAVARVGRSYAGLQIRGQRTRWASCSSSGAMSFNWRLLLAPPEILDYVVEHEVAHLDVHDHSPRFWALLAQRMPDCRRHERWLRANGQTLLL